MVKNNSTGSAKSERTRWSVEEVLRLLELEYGPFEWSRRFDPMTELIFTILTQHTSDITAERALIKLKEAFTSWEDVLEAEVSRVEAAIKVSGLAQQKARRIQGALLKILQLNGRLDLEFLRDLSLNEAKAWLRSLPGVGPKTAGIVLSFSFGMPAMAVDTHIHRVAKRIGLIGPRVSADQAHDLLEAKVSPSDVFRFHVSLITHGRKVCKALRPLCTSCVLKQKCPSATRSLRITKSVSSG
jgi:endonuclease-3